MRGKGGCAGSTTRLLVTVDDMAGVACSSEADPAVPPNPARRRRGRKCPVRANVQYSQCRIGALVFPSTH